jgi:hypothetical protein
MSLQRTPTAAAAHTVDPRFGARQGLRRCCSRGDAVRRGHGAAGAAIAPMLSAGTAPRWRAGLPRARRRGCMGAHGRAVRQRGGPVEPCRAARHLAALRPCSPAALHTDASRSPQRQVYGSRGARLATGRASPKLIEHNSEARREGQHGVQQGYTLQSMPPGSANESLMGGPVRVQAMSLNNVPSRLQTLLDAHLRCVMLGCA